MFKGFKVQDFLALKDLIILMQEHEEITEIDKQILEMNVDDIMEKTEDGITHEQNY